MKFTPESRHLLAIWCEVASSEPILCMNELASASPKVMVPRQSVETLRPERPRLRYSMWYTVAPQMTPEIEFFATCPRGVEALLAGELSTFGAVRVAEKRAGVSFAGTLETGYRACLWSRV